MSISTIEKQKILLKELVLRVLTGNYSVIKRIISKEMRLNRKEKLLDIGCGTGILAPLFSKDNYVGTDIDGMLIAFAKSRHKDYIFQTMNAASLTFPKETFDKILVVGVIHHLDPTTAVAAMRQLKKVLKKDGRILLIEAIPPMKPYNLAGHLLRLFDEGHHILSMNDYKTLFSHDLTVNKSYLQSGGLFDYGIFVLRK